MSTIKLNELSWSNCFSFGPNNIIKLDKYPVVQITAPNGYGKSSIPLILEESLYNKNSKGVKKESIPNRNLKSPYLISVNFTDKDKIYEVNITRGSTIKVVFKENGEDISSHKSPDTFKDIESKLGMNFKTFQQLIYQSTNSSLEFLKATDSNRKKFLIDLFDLTEYTEIFEDFKKLVSEFDKDIAQVKGRINTYNSWLNKNSVETVDKLDLKEVPELIDRTDSIAELKSQLNNISSINSNIKTNKSKIKTLNELRSNLEVPAEQDLVDTSQTQKSITEIKLVASQEQNKLDKLKSLKDICYTCLQPVNPEWHLNEITGTADSLEELNSDLKRLQNELSIANENNRKIKEYWTKRDEIEKLTSSIDPSLSDNLLDDSDINEKLQQIQKEVTEASNNIKRIISENNKIQEHNNKIDFYLEQKDEFNNLLLEDSKVIGELQDTLDSLNILKKAFGPTGLVAYKLENLIKDLETYINQYLGSFSEGRFVLEFILDGDKLNVVLHDEGEEISIQEPSSGELARINISALLGIRKIMSDFSKSNINVLFLDEVISVLDEQGKERLVEILLKETDLNCFLVSHGWYHPLVEQITIEKEKGISRIV